MRLGSVALGCLSKLFLLSQEQMALSPQRLQLFGLLHANFLEVMSTVSLISR
jgi:hypothetical protein